MLFIFINLDKMKKLLLLLLCVPLIGLGQTNQKLNSEVKEPCDCSIKLSGYLKDLYNLSLPYDDVNILLENKVDKDKVIECFNNYTEITIFCVQSFDKTELDNCDKFWWSSDNEDADIELLGETIKFYGDVLENFIGKLEKKIKSGE